MKFVILKQFIPGNDQIWVENLNSEDSVFAYDSLNDAVLKLDQLQSEDPTRSFKIVEKE